MPMISPDTAGLLLGISRQAVSKQRARLERSGMAGMVGSRWGIEAQGLVRWWIGNCRTGPSWDRLRRVRRLLGAEPEAALMQHGGLLRLAELLGLVALVAPDVGVETETLEVVFQDGSRRPLIEVFEDWAGRLEAHRLRTGDVEIDQVSGAISTAEGPRRVWELPTP